MIVTAPVLLEGSGIRLEPLTLDHADALIQAASEGELWTLGYTSVPTPAETPRYIAEALAGATAGHMLPWAVRDLVQDRIVGSTRYHDIVPAIDRVEIGWTWYAKSAQRTHVNSACKLALMTHAFDTLGCHVVGLRTDIQNLASRRAIAELGAQHDGTLRHYQARRDGSARDTVIFSVLASEWPTVRARLTDRLARHADSPRQERPR